MSKLKLQLNIQAGLIFQAVLRAGIAAEIYPEIAKMKKQMTYADNNQIPYVAIVGDSEIEVSKVMLKNMASGEQQLLSVEEVVNLLK